MEQLKNNILECLQEIKGSGKFASIHTSKFVFPGLEVKGLGEISYPINKLQARALIEMAQKAPFGQGTKTILDDKVRSAWEIDQKDLRFNTTQWNKFLDKAVNNVKTDLGLEDYTIKANLYKLLIYQEGDFFLPHKDSEKEEGMFGTLIIGLPSHFTGGELIVSFEGKDELADFANSNPHHSLNYAAFYADCDHQVKPLTSGYRVCLVYNLVQVKEGKKIELNSLQSHAGRIASLFTQHSASSKPFITLLGHQYTPKNFSAEGLKLDDRARAEVLMLAAEKAGYYAKFCLVTSYLSGAPSYDSYDYDEEADMEEVIDEELTIEHWLNDEVPGFDAVRFEEKDLITSFRLNEGEPLIKESTGYMGNYGPDLMHWYHYGAVMVWSPQVNATLLATQNTTIQLQWISYFSREKKISQEELLVAEDILANGLTRDHWSKKPDFSAVADWIINRDNTTFLTDLNPERLHFFFKKINTESWVKLFEYLPLETTAEVIQRVSVQPSTSGLEKLLRIIRAMLNSSKLQTIGLELIPMLPGYFQALDSKTTEGINKKALASLLEIAPLASEKQWTEDIFECLWTQADWNYIHKILTPELLTALKHSELWAKLLKFSQQYLQDRVDNEPRPPSDWSRSLPTSSRYNLQWDILREFMESPTQEVFDFRKNQSERRQMEDAIRSQQVDLKMTTIRQGSPHILRITKTQDAYLSLMKEWRRDRVLLEQLKAVSV